MRLPPTLTLAAVLLAAHVTLAQQALVCAGSAPAQCEAFHYHVQMYRPDSRQFVEIFATTAYASEAACNRAREAQQKRSAGVSDFFRVTRGEARYESDRFGPCHCDLTGDKASPHYLADAQRTMQLRTAEEVRLRVKERLLDEKLTTDHELIRGLYADEPVTPQIGAPKFVPLPAATKIAVLTTPEDLKPTRTIDTAKPVVAALDLPILDLTAPPPPAPAPVEVAATPAPVDGAPPAAATPAVTPTAPATPIAAEPIAEPDVVIAEPQPAVVEPEPEQVVEARTEDETLSAQEAAANFIEHETKRVTNVIAASAVIADEILKAKVLEACMQRLNLLSNLRLLIEGAGTRSRLATAARDAQSEEERLAVVARLFGDDIRRHWAPSDAADVVFNVAGEIAEQPEQALRDNSGRFSARDKKHALYTLLAQSEPTEEQRLWLTTVIEGFLQ
ncbi:MAG TPA: hypothetical protein VGF48_26440 [Thermoanaerobaculia bacterium]|jgi:hypothetical protein